MVMDSTFENSSRPNVVNNAEIASNSFLCGMVLEKHDFLWYTFAFACAFRGLVFTHLIEIFDVCVRICSLFFSGHLCLERGRSVYGIFFS